VDFALRLDGLSAVMVFFVTLVGFLIHVYSVGYMDGEGARGYARYFAYLNLFMFAMLTLVLGANLVVMFVGWEGVGLCSYLLIGYYFTEGWCASAGKKAFIVNRVGDFGFLLGIFLAYKVFGTVDFAEIGRLVEGNPSGYEGYLNAVGLLLFVGAVGKSAQLPLYVWLPDAMAGPTPVSALIHAATMVTAGVYMVARANVVYRYAPEAMVVVAVVGGLTAVFAASIGLAQNDLKKVLAYSTVSQLGYMFLAAGAGAFGAAMFHVFTHAFFKACLFLGAGSVIHALGGEQDVRRMGGLRGKLPTTYWTFVVATLALAGIPVFSGFFSKDEILGRVFAAGVGDLHGYGRVYLGLWVLGVVGAFLTAFYMFRAVHMVFSGQYRGEAERLHHVHEAPATMAWPLRILGVGSVVVGFVGMGKAVTFGADVNWFEHFLHDTAPVVATAHLSLGLEWVLILLSVGVAGLGIFLATRFYTGPHAFQTPQHLTQRFPRLYALLANKYYVDEVYEKTIVKPLERTSYFSWKGLDTVAIDGTLNALAFFTEIAGDFLRFLQTGNVRNYVLWILAGAAAFVVLLAV
ncbi:MAG: NADH-quinone oxidoreductase subunit L, partial [Thermoanaerobaculum sp.]|nr:NADH-quinone oxidoreductase subunit L [Thermoanaerobaculum sp.]